MERKARDAGRESVSPVLVALAWGSKGSGVRVVFSKEMLPSWDGELVLALKDVGERQKSRDHDLGAVDTDAVDPFCKTSMIRRDGRGKVLMSSGINVLSTGWKAIDGILVSSLISLIVNAAYYMLVFFFDLKEHNHKPAKDLVFPPPSLA